MTGNLFYVQFSGVLKIKQLKINYNLWGKTQYNYCYTNIIKEMNSN